MRSTLLLPILAALAAAPRPAGAVRPPGPDEIRLPPRTLGRDAERAPRDGVREGPVDTFDLPGGPRDVDSVVAALRRHLATHRRRFAGLGAHDLAPGYRVATPADDGLPASVYVEFDQRHDGLAVDGGVVAFVVRLLPGRSVATTMRTALYPSLGLAAATPSEPHALRQGGARALGLGGDEAVRREERKIRFVDDFTFKDLAVTIPRTGTVAYTNGSGDFLFPGRPQDETVVARLVGRYIQVESIPGAENRADIVVTKTGSSLNLGFNIDTTRERCVVEADTAQVNAYALGMRVHDWVKSHVPGGVPGIDCPIRVEVNALGSISWYQDDDHNGVCDEATHMRFGEGGICDTEQPAHPPFQNMAYDTVIYHEYGHFVDDMSGRVQDVGLSEGWGDLLATYVTGQPLIGENVGVDFGYQECDTECIRRADNHYQFNQNDGQHIRGMAWSGFGWELRKKLGPTAAQQRVFQAMTWNAHDIPEAVRMVTLADDDDGNLANGTPHLSAICAAAAAHGLKQYVPASCGC